MTTSDQAVVGLTVRDLVLEVRTSVARLHDDLNTFKTTVVTKAEFDIYKESIRQTRRWSLGIIVAIIAASASGVGVVLANT